MRQKYPKGNQDFQKIREGDFVYIDKTALIYDLVNYNNYVFLSRPRRFGKSLLLSTIQAYLEGKKELFVDLDIFKLEKEWKKYPVIHLELSRIDPNSESSLRDTLDQQFKEYEDLFKIMDINRDLSARFAKIILEAHKLSGERVVILIDEYDNPLINSLHDNALHEKSRSLLKSIYSNLKALDSHIKFAMMTGVSRFSKTSIFSGLNNLTDVTFYDDYSAICGFTEEEIRTNLEGGIRIMADKYDVTPAFILERLKREYDGYHFSKRCPDLYNPYSVLLALDKSEIEPFWVETATPEFLIEKLKSTDIPFVNLFNEMADVQTLAASDTNHSSPVALLFQTGYLTIKGYDETLQEYKLGLPNREVKKGLFGSLLSYLLEKDRRESKNKVRELADALESGDPERFLSLLRSFLASVPNSIMPKMPEAYFEHALYIIIQMMDLECRTEVDTSYGRIDLLIKTEKFIYIIEIKLDKSSSCALEQIEGKEYALPYKYEGIKIFNIGVNFSSKTRNITDWQISSL